VAVIDSNHAPPPSDGLFLLQGAKARRFVSMLGFIPREIIAILGAALGILIAAEVGALITAQLPDNSPWLVMLSYAAPTGVMFAIFWVITRLRS
jgi:hypothetical protein